MQHLESRRDFFDSLISGMGGIALAGLLADDGLLAAAPVERGELNGGLHRRAKARRVIQLFMNGGASPCDLFDYKPKLAECHGKPFDPGEAGKAGAGTLGAVLKSPFDWAQHGQSGRWVSSALPHTAKHVDDLVFLMAMRTGSNVHGPASYLQNTGFILPGFPCLGAWLSYGLGSARDNLPAFVALPDPRGLPYNGRTAFTSGFLPPNHQALIVDASRPAPITHLRPPTTAKHITAESGSDGLALLRQLNEAHAAARPDDSALRARMASYEAAAQLQVAAPELLNLDSETEDTHKLYGLDDPITAGFGRNCLLARRMIERGIRFVQVWCGQAGAIGNWDNHTNITTELPSIARASDQPTAALLTDLKQRGLLDDTLLIWTTEFGRTPFAQGSTGRDHNGRTFVSWMAGAGIRPGIAHGQSDEWCWQTVEDPTSCYDFHATILHLLGIDHEKLTVYYNGTQRRLTDVHGHVVREILA